MRFNTKTIHAGQKNEETSGAVMPPIFQTSTWPAPGLSWPAPVKILIRY